MLSARKKNGCSFTTLSMTIHSQLVPRSWIDTTPDGSDLISTSIIWCIIFICLGTYVSYLSAISRFGELHLMAPSLDLTFQPYPGDLSSTRDLRQRGPPFIFSTEVSRFLVPGTHNSIVQNSKEQRPMCSCALAFGNLHAPSKKEAPKRLVLLTRSPSSSLVRISRASNYCID